MPESIKQISFAKLDQGMDMPHLLGSLLGEEGGRLAERIADASDFVVGLGKEAYYAQIDLDQPKAYAYAKEIMSMNSMAVDAQEGISAFLGKRAAVWTGR